MFFSMGPPKSLWLQSKKQAKSRIDQGKRHHAYLSADDVDSATKVGRRHGKPEAQKGRSQKMRGLINIFLSATIVWLTERTPTTSLEAHRLYGKS
jgi:hypothetical protein